MYLPYFANAILARFYWLIIHKFVTLFIFPDQQWNSLTFPGFSGLTGCWSPCKLGESVWGRTRTCLIWSRNGQSTGTCGGISYRANDSELNMEYTSNPNLPWKKWSFSKCMVMFITKCNIQMIFYINDFLHYSYSIWCRAEFVMVNAMCFQPF